MVNLGPPAAEIGSLVWGTPANFTYAVFFQVYSIQRGFCSNSWRPSGSLKVIGTIAVFLDNI